MVGKLTDTKIKGFKAPESGQAEYSDSDVPGLRVRIGTSGVKTFILRKRIAERVRNITIGRYSPRFGLADARKKARSIVSDLEAGKAPPAPQGRAKTENLTIRSLMPQYLESKAKIKSFDYTEGVMRLYVLPELGDRLADSVTRGDITQMVDKIAQQSVTRARATLAQLSAFYTWALPRLDRLPANPCRDAGRPEKPKARDRVLSEAELRGLWRVADAEAFPWGTALKMLILTGARRAEVFGAEAKEFDLEAGEWTIPPERSKNGLPHLVPLTALSLELIQSINSASGKLFPARGKAENSASGFSKTQARFRSSLDTMLERDAGPHWQLHDIRRTVATGLQKLGVRFEVTEAILNHVSGAKSGVAGVYQRHDWKLEKRQALTIWQGYLSQIIEQEL